MELGLSWTTIIQNHGRLRNPILRFSSESDRLAAEDTIESSLAHSSHLTVAVQSHDFQVFTQCLTIPLQLHQLSA